MISSLNLVNPNVIHLHKFFSIADHVSPNSQIWLKLPHLLHLEPNREDEVGGDEVGVLVGS